MVRPGLVTSSRERSEDGLAQPEASQVRPGGHDVRPGGPGSAQWPCRSAGWHPGQAEYAQVRPSDPLLLFLLSCEHKTLPHNDKNLQLVQLSPNTGVSGVYPPKTLDANMALYRFHVQKISGYFDGCDYFHVHRSENEAADLLSKLGSSRQAIPPGIALEHLRKPSIKPSPESESIFIPSAEPASDPMDIDWGSTSANPGTHLPSQRTVPSDPGT